MFNAIETVASCAAAPVVRPAKSGRESSAAAMTGRSRQTAGRTPAPSRAVEESKLLEGEAGQRGAECRSAEEPVSGGEASGRQLADAGGATRRPGDPATRRPGDPATRRPGDPATRRPGDHYTVGTLSGACQPPGRTNCARLALQTQRPREHVTRRAQHIPRLVRHGHRVASEPVARLTVPRPVRRRTQSRQASPVPLAQTVTRTRRQIKTMNADRERTPRDAHLDHHRRPTLSRCRVGRTREGRHDTHPHQAGRARERHLAPPHPRRNWPGRCRTPPVGRYSRGHASLNRLRHGRGSPRRLRRRHRRPRARRRLRAHAWRASYRRQANDMRPPGDFIMATLDAGRRSGPDRCEDLPVTATRGDSAQ